MLTVSELLEKESFFDAAILRHGFTDYMRDYEIVFSGFGKYAERIDKVQFIGCVEAICSSRIRPESLAKSLTDEHVHASDHPEKENPDGFIWGVRYSAAYPGLTYIEDGKRARHWSKLLGRTMHEITLETEAFHLRLVFADVRVGFVGLASEIDMPKDYPLPVTDPTVDGGVD